MSPAMRLRYPQDQGAPLHRYEQRAEPPGSRSETGHLMIAKGLHALVSEEVPRALRGLYGIRDSRLER